jgi:hypothetical protein
VPESIPHNPHSELHDDLVANREIAYEALFAGELPYEAQPAEEDIGLSGLWRSFTEKSGRKGVNLNEHLTVVPEIVKSILSAQDDIASSGEGENGEAVLCFTDTKSREVVTDITAEIMSIWETALWRHDNPLILSDKTKSVDIEERLSSLVAARSLVIETAAAVMTVLPNFVVDPKSPSKLESKDLSKVLANWGPSFLTEWMDGAILNKWCIESGMSEDESTAWQKTLGPGLRKRFAVHNVQDPLGALERAKNNLDILTDEAIAERLGWTADEAKSTFQPSVRKHLAVNYISDPMAGVDKVRDNLALLTDDAIADRLGWTTSEVAESFNLMDRRRFAVSNISDPLSAVERVKNNLASLNDAAIVERLGWSHAEVTETFTLSLRKALSIKNISDPMRAIVQIRDNIDLLTDETIAERLGWTPEQAAEAFSKDMRKMIAITKLTDPLKALEQVKNNFALLTDSAIAQKLGWDVNNVSTNISEAVRRKVAINYINDPLDALARYISGEISLSGRYIKD